MPQLTLNLFGPPQIEVDGQKIDINRRKAVALLAYLATTGQPHTRDALAALFWPESSPKQARAGLRSALWALNKAGLDRWLAVDGEQISLPLDSSVKVDVPLFNKQVEWANKHAHPADQLGPDCLDHLQQAAALYTDDFLAGFTLPDAPAFDEWQFFQGGALRESLAGVLEKLVALLTEQNEYDEAIPHARRWVALDPLHEPAQQTLMNAYAQAGQQPAALRQFELVKELLEKELAATPSAATISLYELIRQGEFKGQGRSTTMTAEPKPSTIRHNLPQLPAPLIGRQKELARIAGFLDEPSTRLLTLLGPGGIGKTRLSLSAALEQTSLENFSDGVYFVPLLSTETPAGIPAVIADAVSYPLQQDGRSPLEQLADFFSSKTTLLILDNFEHLMAGAEAVNTLLNRAPGVKIIATSRQPLRLEEEQQLPLHGLAIPEDKERETIVESESAELFLQSARRRRPDFTPAPDDLPDLARICRLLEGMPLALKLAAAWSDVLSLKEIAAEIERSLDFLETDVRNLPRRHRSMRAVFDGSWERLSPSEKEIYAQLAVFRDGFTREAAEAVTEANFRTLARLLNKSLISYWQHPGRYELHNLLHQYALEKLKTDPQPVAYQDARDAHAAYFAHFMARRGNEINGPRQLEVLRDIENDLENIHFAWQWAVEKRNFHYLNDILFTLATYLQWNGRITEGITLLEPAVTALQNNGSPAADRDLVLVRLLSWLSVFHIVAAHYDVAARHLTAAEKLLEAPHLAAVDTRAEKAMVLLYQSEIAKHDDYAGRALELNEQSLELYREIDHSWGISQAIYLMGGKLQMIGRYSEAITLEEENLGLQKLLGNPRGIALAYNSLGHYELFDGQIERSERHIRQSLALTRQLGIRADLRRPLLILHINLLFAGKVAESIAAAAECLAIHQELGIPHEPGAARVGLARAKINFGRYEEARRQSEDDLERYRRLQLHWYIGFALYNLARIDLIEGEVEGAIGRLEEGIALVRAVNDGPLLPELLMILALAYQIKGDQPQAVKHLREGIELALAVGPLNQMRFELVVMALRLIEDGESERAVDFYAAAQQSPYIANSVWWATVAGQKVIAATAALPDDVAAAARRRGKARDWRVTAEELLAELSKTKSSNR